MRQRDRAVFLVAALAYASTAALGSNGLLCMGPHGHFAVETACEPCPGLAASSHALSPETIVLTSHQEDPCGPCIDLPLAGEHIQPPPPGTGELKAACPQPAIMTAAAPAQSAQVIGYPHQVQGWPGCGPDDPRYVVLLC